VTFDSHLSTTQPLGPAAVQTAVSEASEHLPVSLAPAGRAADWQRRYATVMLACDVLAAAAVFASTAVIVGEGASTWSLVGAAVLMTAALIGLLSLEGSYRLRFLPAPYGEYRALGRAAVKLLALVAVLLLLVEAASLRLFFLYAVPITLTAVLVARVGARYALGLDKPDTCRYRVLALGHDAQVDELAEALHDRRHAAWTVVAACSPDPSRAPTPSSSGLGSPQELLSLARRHDADLIAVTPGIDFTHKDIRELSWALDGTGVQLAVIPPVRDVARSRLAVMHALSGLPLLHVRHSHWSVPQKVLKSTADRVLALVALVLAMPLLALVAVLIRLETPGPVFFRQARVGKDGTVFRVWKFRTMVSDAEALAPTLLSANETDGLLFKMRSDPRVTPLGAWLRKWSVDELPQLVNVLVGEMSLVGPRPLPVSPDDFKGPERRRLLVKPGITGLWQVSGRSDTSWEEAVRLDLYYVDNWSLLLDGAILWRTLAVVAHRSGAY
jgi:exopolysaccharide biosynthesis polyprenyl glycosylphosphotransferase